MVLWYRQCWSGLVLAGLADVCSCCEGMSGVYDIAAHYKHEAGRGVEDVSTMARAMYGPKRFDRFSPTKIVDNLPPNAWSVFYCMK